MRKMIFGVVVLTMAALTQPALAAEPSTTSTTSTTPTTPSTPATTAQTASGTPAAQAVIGRHTHQLHGTVAATPAAGATTFTLTTERYGDVTVSMASAAQNARNHGRGNGRASAVLSLATLKAGDRVVVQGRTSADGKTFVARRVHLLPARDAASKAVHLVGTIAGVSGTSVTVRLADGTSQTVSVTPATTIRPDGKTLADLTVGTRVTMVARNGVASGVVVHAAN